MADLSQYGVRLPLAPSPLSGKSSVAVRVRHLLAESMPLVCDVVGLNTKHAAAVGDLVESDANQVVRLLLRDDPLRKRPVSTVADLAAEAHMARATFYRTLGSIAPKIQLCAPILLMMLAARGDLGATSAWQLCELESAVGRGHTGVGGAHLRGRERLVGVALIAGPVLIPAILAVPSPARAAREHLVDVLWSLDHAATITARYATLGHITPRGRSLLARFELPLQTVTSHRPVTVILAPELSLDSGSDARRLASDLKALASGRSALPAMVVATRDDSGRYTRWSPVAPHILRRLGALAMAVSDVDVSLPGSEVAYWVQVGADGGALRRLTPYGTSTYEVTGLRLNSTRDLASAIAYAELLATTHRNESLLRFSDVMAPSLVKSVDPTVRAVYRALRMMVNAAVVSVLRRDETAFARRKPYQIESLNLLD